MLPKVMANYSLFSTQVVYGELVHRTYIALDAANDRIVAEHKEEVKEAVFDCWPLAFEYLAFRQDYQTNTKGQKPKAQGLLPGLILCFPIRQEMNEEKRDAAQKEHVDPSSFVQKEIKNGPRDQKTTADFPNHLLGSGRLVKFVSDAADGEYVSGILWIGFKLLPKSIDMGIDITLITFVVCAPHAIKQSISRPGSARFRSKQFKDLKL
jgi:hypothetical protein